MKLPDLATLRSRLEPALVYALFGLVILCALALASCPGLRASAEGSYDGGPPPPTEAVEPAPSSAGLDLER